MPTTVPDVPDRLAIKTISDTPYASNTQGNLPTLEVGVPAVPGGAAAAPKKFQTYLMYRGSGGSWVAVAQMNWNWSGGLITNNAGVLIVDPNNPLTSPPPTSVTPPDIGPTHDGLGRDYGWR